MHLHVEQYVSPTSWYVLIPLTAPDEALSLLFTSKIGEKESNLIKFYKKNQENLYHLVK
jgi:hypothetical protein